MEERHRRLLLKLNPHWHHGPHEAPGFRRDAFVPLTRDLEHPQILAVVGLRRVGKTVLLKQVMAALEGTVPVRNIGYISFDDRDFQRYETADDVIHYFLTFSDPETRRYLFLDEIQKVPNWPDLLKTLYDTETDLKMFISGSSSLEMKGYRETLAGRILTHFLPVFTFREYARYFGLDCPEGAGDLAREYDTRFLERKEAYGELFERYLATGGFPELLEHHDEDFMQRYIRESVIFKVISDISGQISPRREDVVNDLLHIFARNTARMFTTTTIAGALGLDRGTVAGYINALTGAFLIKVDHNYSKSATRQARTGKKAYIAHPCVTLALMNYPMRITGIHGSDTGFLVETAVANSLGGTGFWRSPQKHEVDVVIPGPEPLPVEVKYRERYDSADLRGIRTFMRHFGVRKGIVVTRDTFGEEMVDDCRIIRIPAWLFLLLDTERIRDL